jgi:hypothetical protein
MLRIFLLSLAAASLVCGQFPNWDENEIEHTGNSAFYGWLNEYPWNYCHSYCTFEGDYEFMRLWEDADPDFVADTQIFDWSYDGANSFWLSSINGNNCPDIIEYYRYESALLVPIPSEADLRACRPEIIYIEQVEIEYVRGSGHFHWTHHIEDAYETTASTWDDWADLAHGFKREGNTISQRFGPYDVFDGLLRFFPEYDSSTNSLTGRYENDFWYRESYIANYEPNFCSMQMPFQITDKRQWCNGIIPDDTDNVEFPTNFYCDQRGIWGEENNVDYTFGCSDDQDDCDSLFFPSVAKRSVRSEEYKEPRPTKTQKLNRATRNYKQVAQREKRDVNIRAKRQANNAIDIFFRQDVTAAIRFPYCALSD